MSANAFSISTSGFLRFDTAFSTSSDGNIVNQNDNLFNGVTVARDSSALGAANGGHADTTTRPDIGKEQVWNLMQARIKFDLTMDLTQNIRFVSTTRAIYDLAPYEEYDPDDLNSEASGFNYGQPEYFRYNHYNSGKRLNPLEASGRRWMIDLPAAYLDFQYGAFLLRVGSQQIAWGQALFFRVLDVPNGLDLRRHLFIDYAPEEYSDERVPSLGARATWQVTQSWELDGFAQKFQPSVYPNANTPYNAIASQFSVDERYSHGFDNKLNGGMRVRGNFGAWSVQGIAVRRYDPNGVFRWTKSGVNRDLGLVPGTGALLQDTAFEVDPSGVWSADEWFTYAGDARLDGVAGLNAAVDEFLAAQQLGAFNVGDSPFLAQQELDLFFQLSGSGLRGHIAHEYKRENVLGAGFGYVFGGAPGSATDQLILNFESSYTPDKKFTNTTLSRHYIEKDEVVSALVLEKYQRFSQSFPATYLVFQALHKTQSDLYGRLLDCQGGKGKGVNASYNKRCVDLNGFTALVFAFQQPSPTLTWRADFSALYDVRGGLLMQPAVRFSPSSAFTMEVYYNYLNGKVAGHDNENIIQTIEYADELGVRLSVQF